MNNAPLNRIVIGTAALMLALYLIVSILLSSGNSLGKFYFYSAIAALFLGLVAPRQAVVASLFSTAYIDLAKRLMVAYGQPSYMDLYYILGIPPLLIGGACVSIFMGIFMGKRKWTKETVLSLVVVAFFLLVALLSAGGLAMGGARALGDVVNTGVYATFIFLVPQLFPNPEDKRKLLNWILWIFVPVAVYMFRHRYFGMAGFEYDYLLSGLTLEVRVLYDQEAFRGFSTMSGGAVVSVFLSLMVLLVMVPLKRDNARPGVVEWMFRVLAALLFVMGAYFTVSRGGWFCGLGAILVYACLRSKWLAIVGALTAVGGFALLVLSAPLIQEHDLIGQAETAVKEAVLPFDANEYQERAVVLGTMNARLHGWINLTQNPKIYTPFGFKLAGREKDITNVLWGHDMIVDMLINIGYVPMLILAVLGFIFLRQTHAFLFALPKDGLDHKITRLSIAFTIGILIGGLANGAQLRVWPQNYYFYLFISFVLSSYFNYKVRARSRKEIRPAWNLVRSEGMVPGAAGSGMQG